MSNIGRNDLCPCGSGKKFKKCCLGRDGETRIAPSTSGRLERSGSSSQLVPGSGLDIHPYAIAKLLENPEPELLAELSRHKRAILAGKWNRAKVAHLETNDIVSRLGALGIDASPSRFAALAEGHTSALHIEEAWIKRLDHELGGMDEDFALLAACELWKRYLPNRPSAEMVDDWVTDGYDFLDACEDSKAASIWLRVWDHVHASLDSQVKTFVAADPAFKISQFFGNWIQDFEMTLGNAASTDPKSAETGTRVSCGGC